MKNLVKIAALAVLSLGFGVAAQAQEASSERTMTATASVLGIVEVEKSVDLAFGQVMPGFNKYVAMKGDVVTSNSLGTVNSLGVKSGLFKVFAAAGSSITMTLEVAPFANVDNENADPLPLFFNQGVLATDAVTTLAWSKKGEGAQDIPMVVGSNTIDSVPTSPLDGRNGIEVYVGGTVRPAANQASGSYETTITLSAAYN